MRWLGPLLITALLGCGRTPSQLLPDGRPGSPRNPDASMPIPDAGVLDTGVAPVACEVPGQPMVLLSTIEFSGTAFGLASAFRSDPFTIAFDDGQFLEVAALGPSRIFDGLSGPGSRFYAVVTVDPIPNAGLQQHAVIVSIYEPTDNGGRGDLIITAWTVGGGSLTVPEPMRLAGVEVDYESQGCLPAMLDLCGPAISLDMVATADGRTVRLPPGAGETFGDIFVSNGQSLRYQPRPGCDGAPALWRAGYVRRSR